MQTSHKLTRIFVALFTLVVLSMAALAQANPTDISVSDQRAGNVLVYPYYNSNTQTKADTRVTLSNLSSTLTIPVHLFFMDKNCSQADTYVCLTPNASIAMKASEFDPDQLGWILAVAVLPSNLGPLAGLPADGFGRGAFNALIGNAFVQDGDYVGNYGAEAWRDTRNVTVNPDGTASFQISAPSAFAVEIQSPIDAVGQKIVTVGLSGNVSAGTLVGSAQVGTGILYNGNEKPFGSFSPILTGKCRSEVVIDTKTPRVPLGLGNLIPTGHVGTVKFNVGAAVGLIMTPKTAKWSGIRNLHKTAEVTATITIPVFDPMCSL